MAASAYPQKALVWIMEVEETKSWQEMDFVEIFEQLSVKLYNAILKIMPTEQHRRMEVLESSFMRTHKKM